MVKRLSAGEAKLKVALLSGLRLSDNVVIAVHDTAGHDHVFGAAGGGSRQGSRKRDLNPRWKVEGPRGAVATVAWLPVSDADEPRPNSLRLPHLVQPFGLP